MTTTILTAAPDAARTTSGHGALIRAVQEAGLLKRTPGFYLTVLAILIACSAWRRPAVPCSATPGSSC